MNLRSLLFGLFIAFLTACSSRKKVDLLVHHAVIYTADSLFTSAQAFAVKDGKFVAVGSSESILNDYQADSVADLKGQPIYPGFYDPHALFLGLGQMLEQADLVGTHFFDEVIQRLKTFSEKHPTILWVIGRGWDQNDWPDKQFPTKEKLDSAFPNLPVCLTRIDGHAVVLNSKAIRLAGIAKGSKVPGGEVVLANNEPTGVLIYNAMGLVRRVIPQPDAQEKERMFLAAQKVCLSLGLKTVSDAGLNRNDIELVEQLQKENKLKIRDYVMISLGEPNLDYYLKQGPIQTDRLMVRSFKLYADGALGSRGACLRKPYNDRPETAGFLLLGPAELERVLTLLENSMF